MMSAVWRIAATHPLLVLSFLVWINDALAQSEGVANSFPTLGAPRVAERLTGVASQRTIPEITRSARILPSTPAIQTISPSPRSQIFNLENLNHPALPVAIAALDVAIRARLDNAQYDSGEITIREFRARTAENLIYLVVESLGACAGPGGALVTFAVVVVLRSAGYGRWIAEAIVPLRDSLVAQRALDFDVSYIRARSAQYNTLLPPELFPVR